MSEDITPRRSGRKRRANCDPDFEYNIPTSSADRTESAVENEGNTDNAAEESSIERLRRQNRERQRASRQRRRQNATQLSETQLEEVRTRNLESQRASRQRRRQHEGPTVVCVCCGGPWFSNQTKSVTIESLLSRNASQEFIDNVFKFNQQQESNIFYSNYSDDVKNLRTPRLCASNGFELPEIPEALSCLNRVEERLVSARHVFQSIYTVLGLRGQYKSKGGIVNVPVSVDKTMSCVPRSLTDSNAIEARLTRRLSQSNNYMAGNVRLEKIWTAARFLSQSAAYIKHNVRIRDSEEEYNLLSTLIAQNCELDQLVTLFSELAIDSDDTTDDLDNDFMWNINPDGQETMFADDMTAKIVQENDDIRIAPAEGSSPMWLLLDRDVESLAFPTLFGGSILDPKHKEHLSVAVL
ncbi:hypothetical protein A0J61_08133 [Choanephora cucurbitarum]|uniref:DUF6570 domain-containing protein n=1 Tax=Choanephora cucurbitarum TaxID=101091 RepID=A0A1C7N418_9FUNG|nr:hypothetical protein A0J61_08133 [Choanephora cucurbitarum]